MTASLIHRRITKFNIICTRHVPIIRHQIYQIIHLEVLESFEYQENTPGIYNMVFMSHDLS